MPDIVDQRLINQQLVQTSCKTPDGIVRWFGAVQAQDFLGSLWAIGCRLPGITDESVEQAIADRTILRTWPMRGTLHLIPAEDARWMVNLMAPRSISRAQGRYRKAGLDEDIFARAREIIIRALEGDKKQTRNDLYRLLEAGGIDTEDGRGLQIIGYLAQEGLICFGSRDGKQATFVLLDEWAPDQRTLTQSEALAEVALRYFSSHGPATIQDFVWWTGLTTSEARSGLESVKSQFVQETIKDITYYYNEQVDEYSEYSLSVHLLPAYDEFMVGYKDRSAALNQHSMWLSSPENHLRPIILIDGQVTGSWKRSFQNSEVLIETRLIRSLSVSENEKLLDTTQRYEKYLGMPVVLEKQKIKV